ncbi:FAD-binding domain-containing protein [Mycena belliarum]|uniref:FAD-binding domain-containing protein n=1 Tax=Mycena belliarum TaxID=1033014 RepID=A0AAD6UF90_9AGAR|nr:FAD-binding domain-containing protein [Mycena belliae]
MPPSLYQATFEMKSFAASLILFCYTLLGLSGKAEANPTCRNIPGSAGFPSPGTWDALNSTVSGRLVKVVPFAKYCHSLPGGACTDEQWTSALFRSTIPGAMDQVNWEQSYDSTPPSLCLRNATTCGQGDVPLYSVEAETVADIQAAVKFASKHNLRLAVKSTGHDYLGRSTAAHSLLIHTANMRNITFADEFLIGNHSVGSAVTLQSGVHIRDLYQAGKQNGKIAVSGAAATVSPAGGYIQGGGHSALSPTYGLASDNALEFKMVVANGDLLQVNNMSHPDLFYALRGGGSGSWGVIVSATFRTFPTFNASTSIIILAASNNDAAATLATVHAQHIFDMDSVRGAQYFYFLKNSTDTNAPTLLALVSYIPNTTTSQNLAALTPFLNASLALPDISLLTQNLTYGDINDVLLLQADDSVGTNTVLGSRLIPESTYRDSPATVGQVYKKLLDGGSKVILGHMVAGGKVAENANISSAVTPAWRTAKAHLVLTNDWTDSASLEEIDTLRKHFQTEQLPILEAMSGPNAGAYSNEADPLEPDFKTTLFGPNYAKLSTIKSKYDPADLFIVAAGVGSERWDESGLCKV